MEQKFRGWEYGWWWLHVYRVRSDDGGNDRLVLRGRRNVWGDGIGVGDFMVE
jgi:hypothetical protein